MIDTKQLAQLYDSNSHFWFYTKDLFYLDGKWINNDPSQVNIYQLLKGAEMVVFVSTETLYHRMYHGFYRTLMGQPSSVDSLSNPITTTSFFSLPLHDGSAQSNYQQSSAKSNR